VCVSSGQGPVALQSASEWGLSDRWRARGGSCGCQTARAHINPPARPTPRYLPPSPPEHGVKAVRGDVVVLPTWVCGADGWGWAGR